MAPHLGLWEQHSEHTAFSGSFSKAFNLFLNPDGTLSLSATLSALLVEAPLSSKAALLLLVSSFCTFFFLIITDSLRPMVYKEAL